MPDIVKPEEAKAAAEPSPEVNFALVLSRMIDSVEQDPVQLRAAVYELARVKLMEQFGREDAREVKRLVGALETAIAGVETFSLQQAAVAPAAGLPAPDHSEPPQQQHRLGRWRRREPSATDEVQDISVKAALTRSRASATGSQTSGAFGSVARLAAVLVVVVSVGLGVGVWPRLKSLVSPGAPNSMVATTGAVRAPPPQPAPPSEPAAAAPVTRLDYPLPGTFGIYALADQQLFELRPLAGKIPDKRVAMSAPVSGASQTLLPNGNARFIVFRRDAATNAPDNAEVRVIARVTRAMGVDQSGKAVAAPALESYVIRNFSLPYKTGPIPDHPEMYLIQPDTTEATLSPGRYALVIKGQGFDFAVNGAVTDAKQCVERVDAVNGAFYTPCPDKR